MPGPLSGIRVLDLTRVLAGPYATMVLADLGAEVIKIEMPGRGDDSRGVGPFYKGESAYFMSVNRGKKSVTVNAKTPKGVEIIRKLAAISDIMIENFRPGTITNYGLDYESVKQVNPRIIYASISGFGQTGPYTGRPAYDAIVQGMSGIAAITGAPGQPPVRVGSSMADLSAALFCVIGILSALCARHRTGRGQYIDLAMLDSMVALLENAIVRYIVEGDVPSAMGSRHPSFTPFQFFKAKDRYLSLAVGNESLWERFCQAIQRPDLLDEARFKTNALRTESHAALEPILTEVFARKTADEWVSIFEKAGIPSGPINTVADVVNDPHVNERGMIVEMVHKTVGKLKVAGSPINLSEDRIEPHQAAPLLGEHTEEVLSGLLGMRGEEIARLREADVI
ncbi:MAG: CaiB/BaiF CoA-transferase family protein [Planctomycetota bacterium]